MPAHIFTVVLKALWARTGLCARVPLLAKAKELRARACQGLETGARSGPHGQLQVGKAQVLDRQCSWVTSVKKDV